MAGRGRRGRRRWGGSSGSFAACPVVRQRRWHERNAAGDVRRGLLARERARVEKVSQAAVCAGASHLALLPPGLVLSSAWRWCAWP